MSMNEQWWNRFMRVGGATKGWITLAVAVVLWVGGCGDSIDYKNKSCTKSDQCGTGYVCACLADLSKGGVCIPSDIDAGESATCLVGGLPDGSGTSDIGSDGFQNEVVQADGSQNDVAANEDTSKNEDAAADTGGDDVQESKPSCDDGVTCTLDLWSFVDEECVNVPQHGACDDQKPCTKDVCDTVAGCQNTPVNCSVNTYTQDDQHSPKITPLDPEQGACVVWLAGKIGGAKIPDGSVAVHMQCYDKEFARLGSNIQVRDVASKWKEPVEPYKVGTMVRHVDIASSTGNRVAVVWEEYDVSYVSLADGQHRIMGKIYQCDPVVTKTCVQVYPTVPPGTSDPDPGGVISDDVPINETCLTEDPAKHLWPTVAAGQNDDFVVAWGAGRIKSEYSAAIQLRVRQLGDDGPVGPAYVLGNYPVDNTCLQGVEYLQMATRPDADCIAIKWRSVESSSSKTFLATIPKNNIAAAGITPVVEALGNSSNHDHWDITMNDEGRLFIAHQMNNGQTGVKWYANACDALNNESNVGDTGALVDSDSGPTPRITALPSTAPDKWRLFALTYPGGKHAYASHIDFSTNINTYQVHQMSQYNALWNQRGDITYTGSWVAAVTHAKGVDGDGVGVFLFVCDPDNPKDCWMPLPP